MTGPFIGNDVVDLDDPRTRRRHTDERFLRRILADVELRALREAADPVRHIWCLWSAKEAAYKVASKLLGSPPVFEHAAFVARLEGEGGDSRRGTVTYGATRVPVEVTLDGRTVHAVALSPGPGGSALVGVEALGSPRLEDLLPHLSARETDAVHSPASAAVRLAARRALAEALGVAEARLEIVCAPGVTGRRPPQVLLDGAPAPADVSLSHHGAWIAWAVLLRSPRGGS